MSENKDKVRLFTEAEINRFVKKYENYRIEMPFSKLEKLFHQDVEKNCHGIHTVYTAGKELFSNDEEKIVNSLRKKDGSPFPPFVHIAIIIFSLTLQKPGFTLHIYKPLNKDIRKVCAGILEFREVANLSIFLIMRYVMEEKQVEKQRVLYIYRGIDKFFDSEETYYEGRIVGFGHLVSASKSKDTSNDFTGKTGTGTRFFIETTKNQDMKVINMAAHSPFSEQEIVLSPFQRFVVTKVETEGGKRIVSLKAF